MGEELYFADGREIPPAMLKILKKERGFPKGKHRRRNSMDPLYGIGKQHSRGSHIEFIITINLGYLKLLPGKTGIYSTGLTGPYSVKQLLERMEDTNVQYDLNAKIF